MLNTPLTTKQATIIIVALIIIVGLLVLIVANLFFSLPQISVSTPTHTAMTTNKLPLSVSTTTNKQDTDLLPSGSVFVEPGGRYSLVLPSGLIARFIDNGLFMDWPESDNAEEHPTLFILIDPNPRELSMKDYYGDKYGNDLMGRSDGDFSTTTIAGVESFKFQPSITFAGETDVVIPRQNYFIFISDQGDSFQASGKFQYVLDHIKLLEPATPTPAVIPVITAEIPGWVSFANFDDGISFEYPTFGRPSQVIGASTTYGIAYDIKLFPPHSSESVPEFGIAVIDNHARQTLEEWFHQNVDPGGQLAAAKVYESYTSIPNGFKVLALSRLPVPDNYGGDPISEIYALSPSGNTIVVLDMSQVYDLDPSVDLRQLLKNVLTTLWVP